jgi:hypothetical protein
MNPCNHIQELLLNFDWTEQDRQRAREVLQHLDSCPDCAAAVADFDQIRNRLAPDVSPPIDDQWPDIEHRLQNATRRPNLRLRWAMAAAAAILLALGSFQIGRFGRSLPNVAEQSKTAADADFSFPTGDEAHQVEAFGKVSEVFDHQTTWVMNSDAQADMGLSKQDIPAPNHVFLIRLVVDDAGREVSSADLVIVPGQKAEMTVPIDDSATIKYNIGTSANVPTCLNFWAQIQTPHGNDILGAVSTSLQMNPGQKVTAGEITTEHGSYRLKVAFGRYDLPQSLQ